MAIGRDGTPPPDDIGVLWWGNGVELARRVEAFIFKIRGLDMTADQIADQLAELLAADYDPSPIRPPLGNPPTLRPAAPNSRPGRGLATEPGS